MSTELVPACAADLVTAALPPDQHEAGVNALLAVIQKISATTGDHVLVPADMVIEAFKYNTFGKQAVAQADKAVLDSVEKFGLAGDLMKAITAQAKACEDARKGKTDKVNSLVDYISGLFAPGKKKLLEAKAALQTKLNAYAAAEEVRLKEEAAKAAKAAEESALALAATQQAMGDNEGASKVLDDATKAIGKIEQGAKLTGRGVYGSTSSTQKRWVGRVENPAHFLAALIALDPEKILDYVDFKTSALNALAKRMGEAKEKKLINGFVYEQDKNTRVR